MTIRYHLDSEAFTAQECKANATALLRKRSEFERSRLDRRMSSDDRYYSMGMLDEAQVWATLATVPEPLEEIHGQLLEAERDTQFIVLGDKVPELPNLICPHGFAARLSANQAPEGERPRLKYTWSADCPQGCP